MPFIAITTWQWLVLWVYKAQRKTKIITIRLFSLIGIILGLILPLMQTEATNATHGDIASLSFMCLC